MSQYVVLPIRSGYLYHFIPAFAGRGQKRVPELDFYPADVVNGYGLIRLNLAKVGVFDVYGLKDKQFFRLRSQDAVDEFYRIHRLTANDSIVLDKIDVAELSVYPHRRK